jgi:tryptophan-rich sensory protein
LNRPLIYSLAVCAISAGLEGILAGSEVRERFAELRQPRFSPPLPVWFVIGGAFYVVCFTVLYRLWSLPPTGARNAGLGLLLGLMAMNAAWNYVFFRARNLLLSFLAFPPYGLLALALCAVTFELDRIAALSILAYVAYLGYATVWAYALWRINREA